MNNKKLKKSMDYANKEKIPYVIVLGEDEVDKKFLLVKNMFTGNTTEVKLNKLDVFVESKWSAQLSANELKKLVFNRNCTLLYKKI